MIIKIAKRLMPEYIKNKKLNDLFRITADAFQCGVPDLKGLSFAERLHEYAVFTKEQAEAYLHSGDSPDERKSRINAAEEKLYRNSFLLGQELRKSLRVRTEEQAIEALELIYRIIAIDFHIGRAAGTENGRPNEFTVRECYFSSYYSAEVCGLISSLDQGLAAGLTGGGRLAFKERITEGCGCCKGVFT